MYHLVWFHCQDCACWKNQQVYLCASVSLRLKRRLQQRQESSGQKKSHLKLLFAGLEMIVALVAFYLYSSAPKTSLSLMRSSSTSSSSSSSLSKVLTMKSSNEPALSSLKLASSSRIDYPSEASSSKRLFLFLVCILILHLMVMFPQNTVIIIAVEAFALVTNQSNQCLVKIFYRLAKDSHKTLVGLFGCQYEGINCAEESHKQIFCRHIQLVT